MSYKKVADHVDVISSQLWRDLLNEFILRCRYYSYLNSKLLDIAKALESLPAPLSGRPVRPSLYNGMVSACKELLTTFNKSAPPGLRTVVSGDWVLSSDVNALIDCLSTVPPAGTVYLFNTSDWDAARSYVADNTIIITTWSPPTLTSSEVLDVLDKYRAVFVIEVDTEPYHRIANQAYYQVLYTVSAPTWCMCDWGEVLEESFQRFLGREAEGLFDYMVDSSLKVPEAVLWARYPGTATCGWSYVRHGKGAVVEVPCDGFWRNVGVLASYIDALRYTFLDLSSPLRVLHLGHYVSDRPEWHKCYPADACWRQLASQYGYKLVDLR